MHPKTMSEGVGELVGEYAENSQIDLNKGV